MGLIKPIITTETDISGITTTLAEIKALAANGGGIKSVQRGITSAGTNRSLAVTISDVDTSKSFVNIQAYQNTAESLTNYLNSSDAAIGYLESSNSLRLTGATTNRFIAWEVIEFK